MRERISFRPETDDDAEFLYRLYAGSREEEMRMVPWTDEQKEQFLRSQFLAQTEHYKLNYSGAEYSIILLDGRPAGRLYLHQKGTDLRIMDIIVAPEHRRSGIGSILLGEILDRARERGHTVSIHVEQFNPALRLYERLGFRNIDATGVYYLMEWRAGDQVKTASNS